MVLAQSGDTRYLCCNGAEDEPGTFKDRYLLRSNPHQLIEGALLASFAIRAQKGYLYINGSFAEEIQFLNNALAEARDHGHIGDSKNGVQVDLQVVKSPGTYVAGEETALLEVIEGRLAKPQQKPPFYPAIHGLFGSPTVVNNLETICNLPHIVREGASWYKSIGSASGTMIFSLTGDVKRRGLYELPLGTSLRELIEQYGGGPAGSEGNNNPLHDFSYTPKIKAVFPGGPSNTVLPADQIDIPLDFDALKTAGSSLGTGAVIVLSEKSCMVKTAATYAGFFAKESCGQCPPCHLGLAHLTRILQKIDAGEGSENDIEEASQLCGMIKGRGYCYLLTGAVLAVESILLHFRNEFFAHIRESKCPFVSAR
jgi:NADH-quinone oxidoreductase subunit F